MDFRFITAVAGLVLLGLSPLKGSAAQAEVQRCRDSSGTVIYTDRPCTVLSATPVPMPATLRDRIQSTSLREVQGQRRMQSGHVLPRALTQRRTLGCSRSTGQLSSEVQQALASNDVNRFAQSYHWVGQSSGQADRLMKRLEHIVSRPLLDARIFDAQIFSAESPHVAENAGVGIMQIRLGPGSSPQLIDFDVVTYAGCYFARFQGRGYPVEVAVIRARPGSADQSLP